MDITCNSCATALRIPDASLPKDRPAISIACPKCQNKIDIQLPQAPAPQAPETPKPSAGTAAPPSQAAAEPPPPPPPAMEEPPEALPEEEFVENRKLAMACFDDSSHQTAAKTALEAMGFTVHVPAKPSEAVQRLRRSRYEMVLVHEEYGGSGGDNQVLKTVAPMSMSARRNMLVGLVGKSLRTMDHMAAFAKSVNFVVAEKETGKLEAIAKHALADHEQFYRVFHEALKAAGRG